MIYSGFVQNVRQAQTAKSAKQGKLGSVAEFLKAASRLSLPAHTRVANFRSTLQCYPIYGSS
jgi:hypothetical protein